MKLSSQARTQTHTFILAACTLFSCRCERHPPGSFHEALSFLSVCSRPFSFNHSTSRTPPDHWQGKGSASAHIFHLLKRQVKSGWGEKKGSSSSASPSAFIVNNLLSVCHGAVLPLFPLPSFSPAQMGFTRRRRRRARLPVQRSDAEVFLWLMNGTFEVSSLARCPKPASPVVGVNWPVVCLSGSVPSSLPASLVSAATQSRSNNNLHLKNHQLTPGTQ